MLTNVSLRDGYRTGRNDLIKEFYVPCMSESSRFDRAVGFFTSSSLSAAAKGISRLIRNGGTMRLIASPSLTQEDAKAITEGYRKRESVIEQALVRELDERNLTNETEKKRLAMLGWLIAEKRLDIKIALIESEEGVGVYHEKIGIFSDGENAVAFTGSANESISGLVANFESIQVFRSWHPEDERRTKGIISDFEALWSNETPSLKLYPFPEAAKRELLRLRPATSPEFEPEEILESEEIPSSERRGFLPFLPSDLKIREYQKVAVTRWFENRARGIFEMATGTGKTVTALALTTQLYKALAKTRRPLLVVVLCPYKHLVSQWAEESRRFGMQALQCMDSVSKWHEAAIESIAAIRSGSLPFALLTVTNSTFSGAPFQELVSSVAQDFLLIADEVHNLGAENIRTALPENANYRLGLSATPERWFDDVGTQALYDYFGKPVFVLSLKEALDLGALTQYRYFVHPVELDDTESDAYFEITRRIALLSGQGQEITDDAEGASQALKLLLLKRARLIASARNKIATLRTIISPLRTTTHNLFYCGDGTVETTDGDTERQVIAVTKLLGLDIGMAVDTYTSETEIEKRAELRTRFGKGALNGLVAIRCLDEGVDIPATRRAFILASSSNPRQFIQRRGRVLRKAPGKDEAEIHDFVVVPSVLSPEPQVFNVERNLLRRELARIVEFASLARNGHEVMHDLLPLRKKYHLLDV